MSAALDLWRHIFGERRDYLAIFSGLRKQGVEQLSLTETRYFTYPDELDAAEAYADRQDQLGREVYFCAHLLIDRRRVKENASAIVALWADVDGADLELSPIKPTAVVESSPLHFHCYARLSRAIAATKAEQLNKRWALAFGADPSGCDLTQLLRVPGTHNRKYPDAPAVELVEVGP
jgi:hypothetical protein